MHDEGHEIGNHTWDHLNIANASNAEIKNQVNRASNAIFDVTGIVPVTFRPPYGSFVQSNVALVNKPIILWNIDPQDWRDRNADIVYDRVMRAVNNGAIVLAHDIHPTTVTAFNRVIPDLIRQGYTLVTVSELLDINQRNPQVRVFSRR